MLIAEDKAQALEQVRAGLEVWIEEGGDLTELEQHAIKWRILPQFERMKADAEKLRAEKFSAEAQPREDIEEETQPRPEAQAGEVEDDTNPANNIRRKLWRMGQALKYIKAANVELPPERVGSAISWLSGPDQAAGRACFVGCFGEAEGGKLWAMGFPEIPGSVDDIYTVAQRLDWRYPIAVNLNRLDRIVEQTEAALMRARAEIYQAGNELVRPVRVEVQATKGRKTFVAVLVKIDHAFLKTELTKLVDFFTWKADVRKGAAVPNDVVNGLLGNYGRWRFRVVSGIVTTPTMRRDGSVLVKEGWDEATGLIVMGPLRPMPLLVEKPSRDDALGAAEMLDQELLGEFPFVEEASRSAALSGLVTPVVRGAMSAAPLHASSAPAPGTGKSFLWDVSAGISVGDAMPIISVGADLEELEKPLNTEILKGLTIFSIDNCSIAIGGDALCQAIERPTYRMRILSQSKGKDRLNTWTMFASGTNLRVKDDVTRRTLIVRMDAKEENPENRRFKGNPFKKVLDDRGRYIWAALTIVLAYRAAGSPGRLPTFGDPFEEWSDRVRSALVWLGYADPVDTMRGAKDHDPVRQARRAMFQAMFNAYGSEPRTAADMIDDAKKESIKKPGQERPGLLDRKLDGVARDLKAAIMQYTTDRLDSKYLGNKFNADRDRITDGLILRSAYDSHRKVNSWCVKPIKEGEE